MKMKDFYELVRPLQPDAEKAAAEEPPVVKGGRFAGFLFGEKD